MDFEDTPLGHQKCDKEMDEDAAARKLPDWDPQAMLWNLSFLEHKIHQLRSMVHLIVQQQDCVSHRSNGLLAQQQQLVSADLTSIIVQLISTAGSLLPSSKTSPSTANVPRSVHVSEAVEQNNVIEHLEIGQAVNYVLEQNDIGKSNLTAAAVEEHEFKEEEDVEEGHDLHPGSYEVLQLEKEEILAQHTHFCLICAKGFKRDANLRMHMRGHGNQYKTPAALAKPAKDLSTEPVVLRRYSCPFVGCKRNKEHKKFLPLKTILCVKNHYKRTHCEKSYICSRCNNKRFSVSADLKTHEKHCGRDNWLCSCGSTFSRKDKLFGHVALFQGHTPVLPSDETKGSVSDGGESHELTTRAGSTRFNFSSGASSGIDIQNVLGSRNGEDDPSSSYSQMDFEACNFYGFPELPRIPSEVSEGSLSFLLSESSSVRNGGSLDDAL
ncbi:hypothetical protein C5167_021105 [Papaver somniferum]|uniref:C2H2-type domain-containing protein n=2 Tax=Papaver somniferum TaxID=3469 RepID=A0A4Y7IUY6_PAPSO|nr:protein SENSITIVE TO PROTON RHIZOTOXICITY 1-like isoform X1 [Papaver somniferum]XP_026450268.1 protein SENSITIVE TO PROTON RHIZOTOXICITY 1-like isoform X1 [Papaver somniferum]RZC52674.1 hypothetical protein C5167_021105 [Papaver somniferum]